MPFIQDIVKRRSLSIVGLEKNVGKTECLNYVLKRISQTNLKVALTSIGIDGETRDQVRQTPKPEVTVYEGMTFVTTEKLYKQKQVLAEVIDVSEQSTSIGRLVTARAKCTGKVLISGYPDTAGLTKLIDKLSSNGIDLTVVDGALSRLSLASPSVTDAMVLATGAAYSANIPQLVSKTKFIYDLINLNEVDETTKNLLANCSKGIWAIDEEGEIHDLGISSSYLIDKSDSDLFKYGSTIAVFGAVTDRLLENLKVQKNIKEIKLIISDFTKFFATPETYRAFVKKGGTVEVMQKSKLIAVCINPTSPDGYILDSELLKNEMEKSLQVPVYDVRRI